MSEPLKGRANWFAGICSFVSIVFSLGVVSPAYAEVDLLKLPAVKARKAAQALLLNITARGSNIVAVGERGIILRRTIGTESPEGAVKDSQGTWWLQANVPVSVNLTSVAFASDEVLFAVGHDGVILKSEDGASTS